MWNRLENGAGTARRTLVSLSEIEAIAAEWRALETRCQNRLSFFQTYDWCRSWIATFCDERRGPTPFVRTLWQGDTLVCVWPLMRDATLGVRRLESLGGPHAQYCEMLIDPALDVSSADLARLLLDDLLTREQCDVAVFRPVPAQSRLAATLRRRMPSIRGYQNAASVLDLTIYASSADYAASLGKLQKRNRNRRRNHLARLGALDFAVIWPDHPDFAPLVRQAAEMKRRWLAETDRYSTGFAMVDYDAFLAGLDGDARTLSGACLSVLRAGERVVALELGFIRNRHYYAYLGGFDWDLAELSPGKVQMDMTVCWLIDQGVEAYDLLVNPADYKKSWSNRDVALEGFAQPLSWRGRLYAEAWLPTIRPAIKHTHARLPDLLRGLAGWARLAGLLVIYV